MSETYTPPRGTIAQRTLSHKECVKALRSHKLGRVALSVGALPVIFPVTYALDGEAVVIRTRAGSLLDRHCRNTVIAFEIDDHDALTSSGWSVLVVGVANAMHAGDWLRALELRLESFGAPDGTVFVKIVPGNITGRAIERAVSTEQRQ